MIFFFLAFLAIAAVLAQVSLPFDWVPVDLAFLVCVFSGLQRGGGTGFLLGAAAGGLLDSLVSPQIGPRLVAMSLTGALADTLFLSANREQPKLQFLAAAALSFFHDSLLFWAARWLEIGETGMRRWFEAYALPRLLAHALFAMPFYYVFRAIVRAKIFQDPLTRPPIVIRKLPR
jgi:rod shape-determining protein MreD